jgi:hypothetical protein
MRRKIAVVLFTTMISFFALADNASIEGKINKLNASSLTELGISLNALAYLMTASPNSFMPMWHLEESGEIEYIRELEKAGYVKVNIFHGLPDGTQKDEKQVNILPLKTGIEVQNCLLALRKHNNAN